MTTIRSMPHAIQQLSAMASLMRALDNRSGLLTILSVIWIKIDISTVIECSLIWIKINISSDSILSNVCLHYSKGDGDFHNTHIMNIMNCLIKSHVNNNHILRDCEAEYGGYRTCCCVSLSV